jgi:hypothetical protein
MLDRGAKNVRQKVRLAVEMTLDDGKITRGRLVGKFPTLAENLTADAGFLEIEAGDGRQTYISKSAIRKITEISMPVADQLNQKMAATKVGEAYTILGVSPRASEDELMTAYRDLSKVYHPDRLASMELPAEMLNYAEAMQRRINAAFDELRGGAKARGPQPAQPKAQPQPAQPETQPQQAQPEAQQPAQPRHAAQPQPAQPRPDMTFKKDYGPRWATEAA